MLITTTEQLKDFCSSLSKADFVTVDTEFMRERTYWSKLCLVQIAGPDKFAAIDPLADGIDLSPLYELLANQEVLKVFHAARQDVEIFVNATGRVPVPMFDTQVAAMVCGFGDAASYETLADKLAGAHIDKSSRFTDWARRPLTDRQIEYALADVTHLRVVYDKLRAQLEKSGRSEWVKEEMAILLNPGTYNVEPMEAWRRLRLRSDKPRTRAVLREIAAWRELESQRLNVPRGRVMKDEALLEIAQHSPSTLADLARTRGLNHGFAESRAGAEIMEAIARASALPIAECPAGEPRKAPHGSISAVLDLLKVLLKQVCDEHGVASKLIANTDDLETIAA
ncbi:MAG: ribonuclease D, partial [Alphaproteobacteria bacterium]|nr:ribonuclease D [Alphaproteobacteria bacterium]